MRVQVAKAADFEPWLRLAAEVEALFGAPMSSDAGFHAAVQRAIGRGSAFCVREEDGPPGTPLMGGLLLSARPPLFKIGWLAVAARHRRMGVGRALVEHALALAGGAEPPVEITIDTFVEGEPDGAAARQLYEQMGFRPAEMLTVEPHGWRRQVYRLSLGSE